MTPSDDSCRITPGQTVAVIVERLEPYGAWVSCAGQRGLVNIPEISWIPISHPAEVLDVGQTICVKVLAVTEESFRASLRDLHPELDPWHDPSLFSVGTTFIATVVMLTDYGCFLELRPGLKALLRRDKWPHDMQVGDRLSVSVVAVDNDAKKIELSPTSDS